jgi:hypothetical protein
LKYPEESTLQIPFLACQLSVFSTPVNNRVFEITHSHSVVIS